MPAVANIDSRKQKRCEQEWNFVVLVRKFFENYCPASSGSDVQAVTLNDSETNGQSKGRHEETAHG